MRKSQLAVAATLVVIVGAIFLSRQLLGPPSRNKGDSRTQLNSGQNPTSAEAPASQNREFLDGIKTCGTHEIDDARKLLQALRGTLAHWNAGALRVDSHWEGHHVAEEWLDARHRFAMAAAIKEAFMRPEAQTAELYLLALCLGRSALVPREFLEDLGIASRGSSVQEALVVATALLRTQGAEDGDWKSWENTERGAWCALLRLIVVPAMAGTVWAGGAADTSTSESLAQILGHLDLENKNARNVVLASKNRAFLACCARWLVRPESEASLLVANALYSLCPDDAVMREVAVYTLAEVLKCTQQIQVREPGGTSMLPILSQAEEKLASVVYNDPSPRIRAAALEFLITDGRTIDRGELLHNLVENAAGLTEVEHKIAVLAGRLNTEKSVNALHRLYERATNQQTRALCVRSVDSQAAKSMEVKRHLVENSLKDPAAVVRLAGVQKLHELLGEAAKPLLQNMANRDPDPDVRKKAMEFIQ